MRELSTGQEAAITFIESTIRFTRQIKAIREWPDLSLAQRALALLICTISNAEQRLVSSRDLVALAPWGANAMETAFREVEHPPYRWSDVDGMGWVFMPSQTLEYGKA